MAVIIEDGSIVANANSFNTDAELQAYFTSRGYTIPGTEAERDILQIKAMDYIQSLEQRYQGNRVAEEQVLPFPRYGVVLNGFLLASDVIHQDLKNAQNELSNQLNDEEILLNETSGNLESFSVDGVYEESYFKGGAFETVKTGKANAYLSKFMHPTNKLTRT